MQSKKFEMIHEGNYWVYDDAWISNNYTKEGKIMQSKKFKITDETICVNGKILHRIIALRNFGDVKIGDKGGFIEQEYNLSHKGNAWVYDNAQVYDNAEVSDNAWVFGYSRVCDHAKVYDKARVYDNAKVCGDARVCGDAQVFKNMLIGGNTYIF